MADRYKKRLQSDLDRWISDGLVPEANRDAILSNIAPPPARWSAQGAAAILGAILLALAALSFVAANWSELSRLSRFIVILAALSAAYGAAGFALMRNNTVLGHALALLGAALFGAGIVLTAQTLNISAFHQTGLWIWALGALATAIALPSRPVLILASALTGIYAFVEAGNALSSGPVWLFLPLMAAIGMAASRMESKVSVNLLSLSFIAWLGHALYAIDRSDETALALICAYSLCAGASALVTARLSGRGVSGAGIASAWTLAAAAGSLIAAQAAINHVEAQAPTLVITAISATALILCLLAILAQVRADALGRGAAIALASAAVAVCALPWIDLAMGEGATLWLELMVGALVFVAAVTLILIGARPGAGLIGGIGVALFAGQSLYVYIDLFGDLLNTAAFFLIGGLLLIGISVGLTRWRKSLAARSEGELS